MAELPRYVLDASVAGRWYLHDEDFGEAARAVLRGFDQGRIQLTAPGHLSYEVPSLISKSVGAGRLDPTAAEEAVETFFALNLPVVQAPDLIRAGFRYSVRLQCTLYDATYLALSDYLECPFLYADARLRRTLRDRFPRALWLADYESPG